MGAPELNSGRKTEVVLKSQQKQMMQGVNSLDDDIKMLPSTSGAVSNSQEETKT